MNHDELILQACQDKTFIYRFLKNYSTSPDSQVCWPWLSALDRNGYGYAKHYGKSFLAHRVMYVLHYGVIQSGLIVHHICENKYCVNPLHLALMAQDQHRSIHYKSKPHCKRGHDLSSPDACYYYRNGQRQCKECRRLRNKQYRLRNRAKGFSYGTAKEIP